MLIVLKNCRRWSAEKNKKWQATHIAPLQPLILAAFLPWGGSAGAGRARPAGAKIVECEQIRTDEQGILTKEQMKDKFVKNPKFQWLFICSLFPCSLFPCPLP
jgi:hypothetical protein